MLTLSAKICARCRESLPPSAFNRNSSSRDGLQGYCRDCQRAKFTSWSESNERDDYHAQYRARHQERLAAGAAARYRANPAYWRQYRAENRERIADYTRRWALENPERRRESVRRRRARRIATEVGPVDTEALWQHYGGNCPLCYTKIDRSLRHPDLMSASLDHVVPLSKGGTHTQDNLQWTHLTCNVRKGNRD